MPVSRCEHGAYIYAVMWVVCTLACGCMPTSRCRLLTIISAVTSTKLYAGEKKERKLITNDKWTEVADKTRKRNTTTTKIDWPRIYNNASDLEPSGWRAVATQSQNCLQPARGTRLSLLGPAVRKMIINERFPQTVHRWNSTGRHSRQRQKKFWWNFIVLQC